MGSEVPTPEYPFSKRCSPPATCIISVWHMFPITLVYTCTYDIYLIKYIALLSCLFSRPEPVVEEEKSDYDEEENEDNDENEKKTK